MIQAILAKSLAELGKESPDLSYIKGMLEVLAAMQESPTLASVATVMPALPVAESVGLPTEEQDPAIILDAAAKASLATIKALSQKSTE